MPPALVPLAAGELVPPPAAAVAEVVAPLAIAGVGPGVDPA
jgi:hypothetical protein